MSTMKTRRLEIRTDAETEQLVADASALLHLTKTAFIEEVVRAAALKVVARSDVTMMSPEVFDDMIQRLDEPDTSPQLADLAGLPRLIGP